MPRRTPSPSTLRLRRFPKRAPRSPKRLSLDNFIVFPENRFAWEVSRRVLRKPGTFRGPLFIYGPPGVGKTHITRALALQMAERTPQPRIACLTCEDFADESAKATRACELPSWRARHEHLDLFILEQLEGVARKGWLQQELLHTLDVLRIRGVPTVLTARCAPGRLNGVSARLRSYLNWGLTAPILLPGEKSRQLFLKMYCEQCRISLASEGCQVLARGIQSNPRDLITALTLLHAAAKESGSPVTTALVIRYVAEHDKQFDVSRMSTIAQWVAAHFELSVSELISSRRSQPVTRGRQVAIYLARELTHRSLAEIGRFFGGRDHSTVLHACRRVAQICQEDKGLGASLEQLRDGLRTAV